LGELNTLVTGLLLLPCHRFAQLFSGISRALAHWKSLGKNKQFNQTEE
jgi:hypothetical protein